jgi:hypothetical protein
MGAAGAERIGGGASGAAAADGGGSAIAASAIGSTASSRDWETPGGGAGAAGWVGAGATGSAACSRRKRTTRFEIVVRVGSTAVPAVATASKAAAPRMSSLRCSSSSA